MFLIRHDTSRFRRAGTDAVYDALPLVPARRGQIVGQPSENRWWTPPREFGAAYETALATDVLKTTARWLIVSTSAAERLESLGPQARTAVRLVPFDLNTRKRLTTGDPTDAFVALDVPSVDTLVDRLRTGGRDTVFADPAALPALFRLSPIAPEIHCSDEAAALLRELRGVALIASASTPLLAGCTQDMLRIRRGEPFASPISDVHAADEHGFTALHHAADVGDAEAIAKLLQAGAARDALSRLHVSPLSVAAYRGHLAAFDLLLRSGADPSAGAWSAAQWAASAGRIELCMRVAASATGKSGPTPLELAIQEGHDELALRLAAAESRDQVVAKALSAALVRHRHVVVPTLLSHLPFPTATADRAKLLHAAAHSLCPEALEVILGNGVDVDARNDFGSTALKEVVELAVRTNHTRATTQAFPTIELLLRSGANPELRSTKGLVRSTHEAVELGLSEAHADPYATTEEIQDLEALARLLRSGQGRES
jgi:ankyrin repeat protein